MGLHKWSHINWKKEHKKKRKQERQMKIKMRKMKRTTGLNRNA